MTDSNENRPRRKPSQRRSREGVEAIRTAAAQVLIRHGYARATTNRIAEAAGVSVGTLYQYYDKKETIFADVGAHFLASAIDAAMDAAQRTIGCAFDERVRAVTYAGAAVLAEQPGLLRALDAVPGTILRPQLVAARAQARALVERLMAGEAGPIDDAARRRAHLLVAMAEGAALELIQGDELPWLADSIARLLVEHAARR